MSWGETSCTKFGCCDHLPTMQTCNTECVHYVAKAEYLPYGTRRWNQDRGLVEEYVKGLDGKTGYWITCPQLG